MARRSKRDLIGLATEAIAKGGWTLTPLTAANEHPARFLMSCDGVEYRVRLYIWNLSHGGKTRSEDEYRIQVTGVPALEAEPDGRTLILGWSDEFGVFAGFDANTRTDRLHGESPSIQIDRNTLLAAAQNGAASHIKSRRATQPLLHHDHAVAVRPDRLGAYVDRLPKAHVGDLTGLIEEPAPSPEDEDPLAVSLAELTETDQPRRFGTPEELALREEVLDRINSLLPALRDAPPPSGGIGHNKPPEAIEDSVGLASPIATAAEHIRRELTTPEPDAREVGRAAGRLAWAARALAAARTEGAKILEKGKDLAREWAAKALWGTVLGGGALFKEEIIELVRGVARTVLHWLQSVTPL